MGFCRDAVKRFLYGIFGIFVISSDTVRKSKQPRPVAVEK
jgi:hypothetical protein